MIKFTLFNISFIPNGYFSLWQQENEQLFLLQSVRLQTNSNDSDNYNNTNDQSATSFIEHFMKTLF